MPAIPPTISTRLYDALAHCIVFDSNANLRTVFGDQRLYPWRDTIRDVAGRRQERIQALIDDLHEQYDTQSQNALLLFLAVLAEQTDTGDRLHSDLCTVASDLAAAWQSEWSHPGTLDLDTVPDPDPLPIGSRMPFGRNATFTGREAQLKALAQAVFGNGGSSGSTLITQAIQGMGGIGKTQLAVEFAYRYGRFCSGVHWINAAQPDIIAAELAECGRVLGVSPWPETLDDQVALTLATFARRNSDPRLVILDNLENV